ncbi:MAG: hypothetical protein AAFS03_09700, partial [Pseudomonadota bacterium]
TLPDSRAWSLDVGGMDLPPNSGFDCVRSDISFSLTHPDGVTGTFTIAETRHLKGYTGVKDGKVERCDPTEDPEYIPFFESMSLKQKTLSGSGYPSASWTYAYSGHVDGAPIPSTKWGQVTDPLGTRTRTTYHRGGNGGGVHDLEGLPQKTEIFASGSSTPIQTVTYTHTVEAPLGTTWLENENQAKLVSPRHTTRTVLT